MIVVSAYFVSSITLIATPIIWILSIALGDYFTYKYNQKIAIQAEFMNDISKSSTH